MSKEYICDSCGARGVTDATTVYARHAGVSKKADLCAPCVEKRLGALNGRSIAWQGVQSRYNSGGGQ